LELHKLTEECAHNMTWYFEARVWRGSHCRWLYILIYLSPTTPHLFMYQTHG
jgi:hypothetical protein